MTRAIAISRRQWLTLLAGGSLLAAAAGCGGGSASGPTTAPAATAPAAKKAQSPRLTVGLASIPEHFDPDRADTAINVLGYDAVFDALIDFDAKGNLLPRLATAWKLVNPTTWEFKLRPGVKFQNGEPFDAEAVKWNVERLIDPKYAPSIRNRVPLLTGARAVSPETVEFTTKDPDPIFPRRLGTFFMMPPKYYGQVGETEFRSKPSGTGPWRVRAYQKDERIVLERAEGSWRGTPKLDEITLVAMPEGSTRIAALKTGEIDVAGFLPTDQAEAVRQSGLQVKSSIVQKIHIIVLDAVKDSPIKDKRVRLALNYAVNKEALVRNIMQGFAKVLDGQVVGPDGFGYNPTLKAYPYDVAKAKQLLSEAGFPNGFSISMHSPNGGYINDKETAEAIVGYLGAVGIQARLEFNEYADQIQKRRDGKLHPIYLHGYNYFPAADADFTLSWWDSKKTAAKTPTFNNPEFDKVYWASQAEMDPEKRLKLLQQASALLYEDPPVIFLFQPADVFGLQKGIQNFEPRADSRIMWDAIAKG